MRMPKLETIKPHYDKILHVVCTFFAIAWMAKLGCPGISIIVTVLILQVIKTINNKRVNFSYKPYGDWGANTIGWIISALYFWV